jgi:hypothetical protein
MKRALLFSIGLVLGAIVAVFFGPIAADPPTLDGSLLLTQIQALLAGFGPWGVLAAAGIAVYLRLRSPRPTPPAPGPGPTPGPMPIPGPLPSTGRPFLDFLLRILAPRAAAKYPGKTPEEAIEAMMIEEAATALYQERRDTEARMEAIKR